MPRPGNWKIDSVMIAPPSKPPKSKPAFVTNGASEVLVRNDY